MRRETILIIWIGGFVLAAALYVVGPDRFVDSILNVFDTIDAAVRNLALTLGVQAYAVVRALAIALYAVFVVLAVLAAQRGHRAFGALVVVTIVLLALVWRPFAGFPAPLGRWLVALGLVVVGAVVMTQRLMAPVPRRDLRWPPPPEGRP